MIAYRRLTDADIDAVTDFATEGLDPGRFPLVFSRAKTRSVVEHFSRSTTDFHLVAFDSGRVVGAIAAVVSEMPFFERCEAQIFMLYATVPGVGLKLMRALLGFVNDSLFIRRVVWAQNPDSDPRTASFAKYCARLHGMQACQVSMQVFLKS